MKYTADQYAQAIGMEWNLGTELVTRISEAEPELVAQLLEYVDMHELSSLTGYSVAALAECNRGNLSITPARNRLAELRNLFNSVAALVREKSFVKEWLHKQIEVFNYLTPLTMIEIGHITEVWDVVHELEHGGFS